MILLWGLMQDKPLAAVHRALQKKGASVALADQLSILNTTVDLRVNGTVRGMVKCHEAAIPLEDVTAVYMRAYDFRRIPAVDEAGKGSRRWRHAMEVTESFMAWLEVTSALLVNPLDRMAANNSKPYQSIMIRSAGFDVPDTLITTDPAAVVEFMERHEMVIYKSISGTRSIVSRLSKADMARVDDVTWCPTQFQEYVPGTDYRVHVVGDDIFACKVVSDADDYRYASGGASASFRPCWLPHDQAAKCLQLARASGLSFAGIDLRCTPDGRWFCFEVNPSPGFTYYQAEAGQPIDEAVARMLMQGGGPGRRES